MQPVRKSVTAAVKNVGDDSEFPGSFEMVLSNAATDRDGESCSIDEWELPLPDHITLDEDHGMSVATTVGSGTPSIENDTIVVRGAYSSLPRAQDVRTLVNEGHIKTTSVAFLRKKTTKSNGSTGVVRELLNGAFVAVPSNREALIVSSKSVGSKSGARNAASDQAHLDAAVDHLIAVGAVPSSAETEDDDSSGDAAAGKGLRGTRLGRKNVLSRSARKSIVGSVEALQDRVSDALEDAYATDGYGWWGWLRGVVPGDGGGTAVFQSSRLGDSYESATYSQVFTDDGAVVLLVGTATEVDIHEVIAPDADGDRQSGPAGMLPAPTATVDDELVLASARARARIALLDS